MVKTCQSRRFGLGCGLVEGGIPPVAISCLRGAPLKLYCQGTNEQNYEPPQNNCRLRNKITNDKKEAGESYAQVPLRYIFETYSHRRG